jgi:CRISPR-associated protein Csd1
MSWMAKLYETYEQGMRMALPGEIKLMPISHTLQNTHINIVIDGDGNFKRAAVLEKKQIVLPATERSAGRASGEAPHPLADKIQYVAKDYPGYGGKKKAYFAGYKKQLAEWCQSEECHPKIMAVLKYIEKGHVVKDLIENYILYIDDHSQLLTKWPEENGAVPEIFKVLPKNKGRIEPGDALVCWTVEVDGEANTSTWDDERLQQSWIDYNARSSTRSDCCFVTGADKPVAVNHPAKLRHTGDKAKLISANDSSGFTFRGRFTDPKGVQAATVSYEVTQKAHNALRWLISRQGFRNGDQVFVSWAVSGKPTPEPLKSAWELFSADTVFLENLEVNDPQDIDHSVDMGESFARQLNKYLAGYHANLTSNEQIVVMGLDSATPGRMGIIYYRELLASEFIERIEMWHNEFAWPQRFSTEIADPKGKKKPIKKTIWPASSPAPRTIAEAAYGNILKSNNELKKSVIERILPCIVDGRPFPKDVLVSAVHRACNRNNCEKWEWDRNIGVACALYKGFYLRNPVERREYHMALEEDRNTRDYLYGRLLAIAERIEETALRVGGEERPTTAAKMMQRFADRPFSTWRNIELALQPYMQRLQNRRAGFLVNRKKELGMVMDAFSPDDFTSEKPLSGEFLLGYHCQKQAAYNKIDEAENPNE